MPIPNDVFETNPPMDYSDLRPLLKNGDILLFSGPEPFSKLIQMATGSPWSHVGFVFKLGPIDRVLVVESVDGAGVRVKAFSLMLKGNGGKMKAYKGKLAVARHDEFETASSTEKMRAMSEFAVDRLGSPYDLGDIIQILFRIVGGWMGRKLPAIKPNEQYICSEYAAACYGVLGLTIPASKLGFIAPSDFAVDPKIKLVGVVETEKNRRALEGEAGVVR